MDDALRGRLEANLAEFDRETVDDDSLRHAAVAIVLVEDDAGEACFLLTRRSRGLQAHASHWALPGGRLDADESAEAAALRELHEEIGLRLDEDAILGLLDDFPSRSGYRITPVVVWGAGGGELSPNPEEVASVHRIPLATLDRDEVTSFRSGQEGGSPFVQLAIADSLVFAPTAAMLYQFREVGLRGRSTRVSHFEEPGFVHR